LSFPKHEAMEERKKLQNSEEKRDVLFFLDPKERKKKDPKCGMGGGGRNASFSYPAE